MIKYNSHAPKFEVKHGKSGELKWTEVVCSWVFDGKNQAISCERCYHPNKPDIHQMKLDTLHLVVKKICEHNSNKDRGNQN